MPNLEVHGYELVQDGDRVSKQIWQAFTDAPFVSQMVVTWIPSRIVERDSASQPFVRVYATTSELEKHGASFKKGLHRLGLDVEMVMLHDFSSARS